MGVVFKPLYSAHVNVKLCRAHNTPPLLSISSSCLRQLIIIMAVTFVLSLVSSLLVLTSGFIVQEHKPQVEVRVNYGTGLEKLLVEAVQTNNAADVIDILVSEIDSIESRVRSRGFWYMGEGARQQGADVEAVKQLVDDLKTAMEDTIERLRLAKQEIKLLLQEIPVTAGGMEETLLDILASIRDVPAITELHYRDVITGGFELKIKEIKENSLNTKY